MKYIKLKVWWIKDEYEDVIFALQYAKVEEWFLGFKIELSSNEQDMKYIIPVRTKGDADNIMNRILREDNIDLNMRAFEVHKSASEELCNDMIEYNSSDTENVDNVTGKGNDLKRAAGFSAVDED